MAKRITETDRDKRIADLLREAGQLIVYGIVQPEGLGRKDQEFYALVRHLAPLDPIRALRAVTTGMTEQNNYTAKAIGLRLSKIIPAVIWEEQNKADDTPSF